MIDSLFHLRSFSCHLFIALLLSDSLAYPSLDSPDVQGEREGKRKRNRVYSLNHHYSISGLPRSLFSPVLKTRFELAPRA